MTHLFRPADPPDAPFPPGTEHQWSWWTRTRRSGLTLLTRTQTGLSGRRVVHTALLLLGLVVQGALLLTTAYLCDLSISLMELWAELARKHLELTL